jgi:polyphosphate kinase
LQRKKEKVKSKELIVAPFNLRKSFIKLIDNEIQIAKEGKPAEIIIKLNSLEDRKMIKKLYDASNAGVKARIIVRGICCLIPDVKELSENIEVVSIVDRFLEHARVFVFHNGGDNKYFLSSADWMKRNLSRRIEVAFPVYDKEIQKQLQKMIDLQLSDNVKARVIDKEQKNEYGEDESEQKTRSQYDIYNYIKKLN